MKLILASLSATRRDMLEAAGIRFEAHSALLNEEKAKAELRGDGLAAHAVAKSLAELKALSIEAKGALVIGSDQTLEFGDFGMLDVRAPRVLLDIPLLFEIGGWDKVDTIVVVSAPAEVQRARVLARPGMTREKFDRIIALQTPDAEKRARADFVVPTGGPLDETRAAVRAIIACLGGGTGR